MDERRQKLEWLKASKSFLYFVISYIYIYDAIKGTWIPFNLWDEQKTVTEKLESERLVLILKARQLGITWLCLAYVLWLMLFKPAATALLFSRRETEAGYLMWRLKGMYKNLPSWMQARQIKSSNTLSFALSNGSVAYGFPTTAGDSYTATVVLVDEADLIPNLDAVMSAVKPTIDAGGKMIMISRTDKENPTSPFKNLFKAALKGENDWIPVFLPWWTRPDRTQEWYNQIKKEIYTRTLSLDELYEQYPATPEEALQAIQLDKRFPIEALEKVYRPIPPVSRGDIPGLIVFKRPDLIGRYVIGADPAEGNPTSDDSSAHVVDKDTGEEMALLKGKIEPTVFASYLESLSRMYNNAKLMVERNNHGHTVIAAVAPEILLEGLDKKLGWHTSKKSKAQMYAGAAEIIGAGGCTIHSKITYDQLVSIEGNTLAAPKGLFDDEATSFCLALLGISGKPKRTFKQDYRHLMFRPKVSKRAKRIFG